MTVNVDDFLSVMHRISFDFLSTTKNPKFEFRNPKQDSRETLRRLEMLKTTNSEQNRLKHCILSHWDLFRVSDFVLIDI